MEIDPQDSLVTSTEDVIRTDFAATSGLNSSLCKPSKSVKKKRFKDDNDQFPWLHSFTKLYRSMLGSSSMKLLLNLITVYTEHVSRDVAASYSKPNRAAKLKRNMIEAIVLFHNCYTSIKTPLDDSLYMEKMSDLLTMYIDMEIKASRRGKESVKKITSKLISALFIVLNNSYEYIIDTILKVRFTVKRYREICIPILKRVSLLAEPQEVMYVRCLLVMKLWKRLLPRGEERNSINRLAVARLGTPPPALLDSLALRGLLAPVLPPLPANKKPALLTRFFMVSKLNLRESIKAFLKITSDLKLDELTTTLDSSKFFDDPPEELKDHNFMEAIWENITDFTYKLSDNTSVNTIRSSKLLTPEKRSTEKHKPETVEKIKVKKKNKASDKGADQRVGLTWVNKKCIPNLPSDISKRIKLDTDVKGEKHKLMTWDSNQLLPSITLSNEKPSNFTLNLLTNNLEGSSVEKKLGDGCSTSKCDIDYKVNDGNSTSKKDIKPNLACKKISDISTGFEKCLVFQSCASSETSNSKQEEDKIDKLQPALVLSTEISEGKLFKLDHATTSEVQGVEDDTTTSHKYSPENTNICFEQSDNESISHLLLETKSKKPTNSTTSKLYTFSVQNKSANNHQDEEDQFNVSNQDRLKDNGESKLCSNSLNKDICKSGFKDITQGLEEKIVPSQETQNFSKSNLNDGNNNNPPKNNSEPNQANSVIDKCVLKIEPSNLACMFEVEKFRSLRDAKSTECKRVIIKSENDFKECDKRKAVKSCSVIIKKELANCEQNKDLNMNVEESITERGHDLKPPFQDSCSKDQMNYNYASSFLSNKNIELRQPTKKDACLLHKILGEGICPKNSSTCLKSNASTFAQSSSVHSNKNSEEIKLINQQLDSQSINPIITSDWNNPSTSIKQEKEHDIFDTGHVVELNKTSSNTHTMKLNDYLPTLPLENEFNQDEYHLVSANDYCSESDDSNLVIDEDLCYIKDENVDEKLFGTNSEFIPSSEIKGSLNNTSPTISNETNKPLLRNNDNLLKVNSYYSKVESSSDQLILEGLKHSRYFTEPQPPIIGEMSNNVRLQAAVSGTGEHITSNNNNGKSPSFLPTNEISNFNSSLECKSDMEMDLRLSSPYQFNVSKVPKSNQMPSTNSKKYLGKINQTVNAKTHSSSNILQNSRPMLGTTNKAEGCPFSKDNTHLITNQIASNLQHGHVQEPLVNIMNSANLSTTRIAKKHNQDKSTQYYDVENKKYMLSSQSSTLQTNDNIEIKKDKAEQLRHLKNGTILSNDNLNQFVQHYHTSYAGHPPKKPNHGHKTSIQSKSEEKLNIVHKNTQGTSLKYASQEVADGLNKDHGKTTVNVYYSQGLACNQTSLNRKYQAADSQEKFANPDIFCKTVPTSDPLCLVMKNSDEYKETSEFEFNIFPVAHEVEICSASDSLGGEWTCAGSSEIGHPDWPIANEQSVIDSSNSLPLSSTIDQTNYPLQVQSDLGCGLSEDDPNSLFNSLELQQVSVDINSTEHVKNRLSKEKLTLHIKTLEVDYNLCCSQRKFKEFYLSQNVPPAIPVPFPPQGRTDNKSSVRCTCDQCSDNHQKLLSNYNILTHFRNSKVKPTNVSNRISDALCDKDQICDQDCSLPLKKRKTLTTSKLSEEPTMMSYPNTPMISIAQLELAEFNQQNQVIPPNLQPWQSVDSSASTQNSILPDYSSMKYIEPKNHKYSFRKPSKRRKSSR